MIVMGIDPSRSATGLAVIHPERNKLHTIGVYRPDKNLSTVEQEAWIASEIADLDLLWRKLPRVEIVGIEWPPEAHRAVAYTRKDGTTGSRAVVSASQWRLIGRLQAVLPHPQVLVSPQEVKLAAGLSAREKRKPVEEMVERFDIHMSKLYKYQQEAIADACAAALAAYEKYIG